MGELTTLLEAADRGDPGAFDRAYACVYDELRRLARAQRGRWRGDETLNTTALVHEAYLKLARWDGPGWRGRGHFFALAARAMRQILVTYAERRQAAKRGGGRTIPSPEAGDFWLVAPEVTEEILALHEALERLEQFNDRQARVVECRFFAGLSIEETAEALSVSAATVKRDWRLASAWLYCSLEGRVAGHIDASRDGAEPSGAVSQAAP